MTRTAPETRRPDAAVRHSMIFVNLPVEDVAASREFFTRVGYSFDEQMCNGSGLAVQLGPRHFAMLLQRDFFAGFHTARTAARGDLEVLTCLSADSREEVDLVVDRAVTAGGVEGRGQDEGFMYGRTYTDLDGHVWEIMWMDVDEARCAGAFG